MRNHANRNLPDTSIAPDLGPGDAVPAWMTPELIQRTLDVWQPRYATRLTRADAIAILHRVGRLMEVLRNSSTVEQCT